MRRKTTINITHRIDVLKEKEKIIVMSYGQVVEEGSF